MKTAKRMVFCLIAIVCCSVEAATDVTHVYETLEVSFSASKSYDNPYLDVDLWVNLSGPDNQQYRIPAFWDGGQTFRARLAATTVGDWHWSTGNKTDDPGLDGKAGQFRAIAWSEAEEQANANRRGFVRVSDNKRTLEYADGTPFFYTGDTWWSCLTGVYGFDAPTGPSGISFKDAVKIRKAQGFNGINIISCFPSELTKPIWHKNNHKKKIGEDGSTAFVMDFNEPDLALAVNYLHINPGYWQEVDRKMQHFWDQGFCPFIETVRRSETWPEENEAEQAAFTNFVRYFWARYGTYNFIFSWLHWDWGKGRNEAYRPMIDAAYAELGDMPYGQPMTAMAAGASDDTWGTQEQAPWLTMHNVSNLGRDARMFGWLRRQFDLPNPLPAMNVEPFYPGWNNKPVKPLNDSEMAQFMMYGSVLNGGLAGHAWGDDYYSGNRKFGGDPHVKGFNQWCAASMGHLKNFMLDKGHDYSQLAPALSHIVDHQKEFLCLALYPDKSIGLGYVSAKMMSSDLQKLKANTDYTIQWWDIDGGGWCYVTKVTTDASGHLVMPAKPDDRGWAYRITSDKAQAHVGLISTIVESTGPAQYGLSKLEETIAKKDMLVSYSNTGCDFYIIAGLSSEKNLVTKLLTTLPQGKEALCIKKTNYQGKPAVILCGGDEVGLMYAALDVAKRISWSQNAVNPFMHVNDVMEKPEVKERAVSTGSFHRRYFEERLHDAEYWETYFDMMAEHRLNQFLLIFGYKNNQYRAPNFMAPCYPNFFDLEEYPHIKLTGMTSELQAKNTLALKKVIELAHERGIEFGVGLWDQIERSGNYLRMTDKQGPAPDDVVDNLIWGLNKQNLIPYSKLALRKFLQTFPNIDLVQFRMHWEAGITGDVALEFWKEIFEIVKAENPSIKIEARAKDVPDETLYDGVATGTDFRVATKHWMEQMGMPFHPTHVNQYNQHDRRHGYADLLRYPQRYGFKWRVWNGGTTRVLLWGDPDWVRLYAEGCRIYESEGFEFNEPLYFKMNGSPHDKAVTPILNPEHQYYRYEFERYWHFYQVMGRVGYNPQTPSDTWLMEFKQRFGSKSGPELMQALHLASKVLPRIVSASYLYSRFSSPQGWPELQRLGDLEYFATKSEPSDTQQFASPMEEAELIFNGQKSAKRLPSQTSVWFHDIAKQVLAHVTKAEAALGDNPCREALSTVADLKMLAQLSLYHSGRLAAAVQYALYQKMGDLVSFDQALELESQAVDAYSKLVEAAGEIYNSQLDFGSNEELFPGHWSKEHQRLVNELKILKAKRPPVVARQNKTKPIPLAKLREDQQPPQVEIKRIVTAKPHSEIKVSAHVTDPSGIERVVLRYRRVSQFDDYQAQPMAAIDGSNLYEAIIPASFTDGKYDVMYFIEAIDKLGNGRMYPDMEKETPYVIVRLDRGFMGRQGVMPVAICADMNVSAMAFAVGDIQLALAKACDRGEVVELSKLPDHEAQSRIVIGLASDKAIIKRLLAAGGTLPNDLSPEGYTLRVTREEGKLTVWAIGADVTGAMYGGLAMAEAIGHNGLVGIQETECKPFIGKRGLKINVPLDARTPAYADCGDAAQQNMTVMWELDFWKAHLDQMARNRYNTITLWNGHPFPSMVKVPDYPDVALEDVMIADIDWREWHPKYAGRGGSRGVTQEILDNLKVAKKMTMDEKIAFWREVMQYGKDRGIEFHIITWNIFVWGAEGKYGITHHGDNEITIDYLRKSVKALFETYPLLAGIGVTAGERMQRLSKDEKETWLWKTYGLGVMDAKQKFHGRPIRFIHRYWMTDIPEITKHFEGFDEDITFNFSYKYVKARLYAHTDPPFVDKILEKAPEGTKWWWNLRNDDIFYFRWGDPDYVRDFMLNLPPAHQTEGFHMGSDGYVWGREFVSKNSETQRQLEIDKHWYRFMLWGRLGYDPSLTNDFFMQVLQERFPGERVDILFDLWQRASKIIPAVNRFHWHDWDFQWAVEACQGRNGYHAITDKCWKMGGGDVADEIEGHAEYLLKRLSRLNSRTAGKAWRETTVDLEAMSHLGLYYAEKFRAADHKDNQPKQAIEHLRKAAAHWKNYGDTASQLYKSQLLSKAGWADWEQGYENALQDIVLLGGDPNQP